MLGFYPDISDIEVGNCVISADEAIILTYTDGLTDIKNAEKQFFSEELLAEFASDHYHQSAARFNERLMSRIDIFRGEEAIPDDFTVLTCKVYGAVSKNA